MFFIREVQDILEEKVREVVCSGDATARVFTNDGTYFIKYVSHGETEAFYKEARGLKALRETGAIDVIEVLGVSPRFLLLEYVESRGFGEKAFFQDFGARLARMHQCAGGEWGFVEDNFLGRTPQPNLNPRVGFCGG